MKKILVVGNYKWDIYEEALINGFRLNDIDTFKYIFPTFSFKNKIFKFLLLRKYNKNLEKAVYENNINVLFIYRCNEIFGSTLKALKNINPNLKILIYHNDNPFVNIKTRIKYFLFINAIKYSDIAYAYRPNNLTDLKNSRALNPKLLYPHYYTKNDLVKEIEFEKKSIDIVFIGHYEPNRSKTLNYLIKNEIKVKIFGSKNQWNIAIDEYNWDNDVISEPVYGEDYKKTINKSFLSLCFLSRINEDVYTRRNFEIPAAGSLCVSEYSDELCKIFKEDKEIILFKNDEELLNKVKILLENKDEIFKSTFNVHSKLKDGLHSEYDRAQQIIKDIDRI